ncbi:MAG TPA: carbon storage regulator [Armatimonadota bacterium]|jgi:carbon storage regulator
MLVLTRKQGQSIVIGDSVEVFIVEVRGDQVRLGIEAPRTVPVVRREVLVETAATDREAAVPDTDDGHRPDPGVTLKSNGLCDEK